MSHYLKFFLHLFFGFGILLFEDVDGCVLIQEYLPR